MSREEADRLRSIVGDRAVDQYLQAHRQHRAGDEMACSCGKRWPVGEDHP